MKLVLVGVTASLVASSGVGQDKFKFTDPKEIPIPTEAGKKEHLLDIDLETALRRAVNSNVDLAVSRLSPGISKQDLIVAKAFYDSEVYAEGGFRSTRNPSTSPFAPEITREILDANVGWRKRFYSGGLVDVNFAAQQLEQSVTTIQGFPTKLYDASWNVSYTQPLWRSAWWEYSEAEVRRAEAGQRASVRQYNKESEDLLLGVVRAYWELVFAREDYRVHFQALELAQEQLRITNARIAVKDLAERDRVSDEAEVARRREGLIVAENAIRQREDELRALVFRDQEKMWDVVIRPTSSIDSSFDPSELAWRDTAAQAMRERPDLDNLRESEKIAMEVLSQTQSELNPQLDLVGSYNSGASRPDSFSNTGGDALAVEYPDWSLRLQFAYPLGNRAARARLARAELDLEAARSRVYALKVKIQQEVRDAVRSLQTLSETIKASQESVRLADNDLDTARHKLRVGTLTHFDVQQRNQELQAARSRLLRNLLDFRVAEAVYQHARGLLHQWLRPPAPEK